jgi:hypothetical protein
VEKGLLKGLLLRYRVSTISKNGENLATKRLCNEEVLSSISSEFHSLNVIYSRPFEGNYLFLEYSVYVLETFVNNVFIQSFVKPR